jgi:GWxTD domain-containing protein
MMARSGAFASFTLAAALCAPLSQGADDPMFATFVEVKTLYKTKRFEDAELALRRMSELLAAPEYERVRTSVLPAFQFYSSAVYWELNDEQRAKTAIRQYLSLAPNAELDRSLYPRKFAQFFEVEKGKLEKQSAAASAAAPHVPAGLLAGYTSFIPDVSAIPQYSGAPEWSMSPVRFILTPKEKHAFETLGDDEARREWVAAFWRTFDPDPLTQANEFQEEFYRRVQYADANFSTEKTKGSLSDRGMVLIALGPPTFSNRGLLRAASDTLENARHTTPGASMESHVTASGSIPGNDDGVTEAWTYRAPHLPRGIPYTELTFEFFTSRGYGEGVLQKDERQLTAVRKAVSLLRGSRSGG